MNTTLSSSLYPTVGQRIRLRRPASIDSGPRGEAGMTGMVHMIMTSLGREAINARMDQQLTGAPVLSPMEDEVWRNCLEWKGLHAVGAFLDDCEFLPSFPPIVGQRIRLVREVDRTPYFRAKIDMTGTLTKVVLTPGAEYMRARIDQPLSDNPERQASIEEEWGNCIEWDQPDFIPLFFVDCVPIG